MKKIYVQKNMFLFMNFFSTFFLAGGLYGGIVLDKSWFQVLFVSLGLSILSLLFLVNQLYYDENKIKFSFIYKKVTVKYEDIKEIFVDDSFIIGAKIIFNLDKKIGKTCCDYLEYTKICKKENIKNIIGTIGMNKKDLKALLKYCNCNKNCIDY